MWWMFCIIIASHPLACSLRLPSPEKPLPISGVGPLLGALTTSQYLLWGVSVWQTATSISGLFTSIHIYSRLSTIYIYIYRERERESSWIWNPSRNRLQSSSTHMPTQMKQMKEVFFVWFIMALEAKRLPNVLVLPAWSVRALCIVLFFERSSCNKH